MNNINKVITTLHQVKDTLEPKRRKKVVNIIKELQQLCIDEAQSISGKPIKSYSEAQEIIRNEYGKQKN